MRYTRSFVKCDRCGDVFEEEMGKTPIVMWMSFQSFNGKRKYSDGEERYHLCLYCEQEFIDWFCADGEKRGGE